LLSLECFVILYNIIQYYTYNIIQFIYRRRIILITSDVGWVQEKDIQDTPLWSKREKRKLPRYFLSEKWNKICHVLRKIVHKNDLRIGCYCIRVSTMAQKTKRLIFPHACPRVMFSRGMSHCATFLHFDFRILSVITWSHWH